MPELILDIDRVIGDLETLGDDLGGKAMARALNRTATTVRTALQRWTKKNLNLRAGDINKRIIQRRAVVRQLGGAEAVIEITARPMPMIKFVGTRQVKRGVSVKIKRTGSRKLLEGAFITTMGNGFTGVFRREGDKVRTRRGRVEQRIKHVLSTDVAQYIDDDVILHRAGELAREAFDRNIDHEIRFRLDKRLAA